MFAATLTWKGFFLRPSAGALTSNLVRGISYRAAQRDGPAARQRISLIHAHQQSYAPHSDCKQVMIMNIQQLCLDVPFLPTFGTNVFLATAVFAHLAVRLLHLLITTYYTGKRRDVIWTVEIAITHHFRGVFSGLYLSYFLFHSIISLQRAHRSDSGGAVAVCFPVLCRPGL